MITKTSIVSSSSLLHAYCKRYKSAFATVLNGKKNISLLSCIKSTLAAWTIAAISGYPLAVRALPFNANPQSFQYYANQIDWGGGGRTTFQNLHSCKRSQYVLVNYNSPRALEAKKQTEAWQSRLDNFRFQGEELPASYTGCGSCEPWRRDVQEHAEIVNNKNEWDKLSGVYAYEDGRKIETFSCSGYVTVSDPRGTRICKANLSYDGNKGLGYNGFECRWK